MVIVSFVVFVSNVSLGPPEKAAKLLLMPDMPRHDQQMVRLYGVIWVIGYASR